MDKLEEMVYKEITECIKDERKAILNEFQKVGGFFKYRC